MTKLFAKKGKQTSVYIEGRGVLYITENIDGVSIDLYSEQIQNPVEPILAVYALNEDFDPDE
jgi:hypothetical protein